MLSIHPHYQNLKGQMVSISLPFTAYKLRHREGNKVRYLWRFVAGNNWQFVKLATVNLSLGTQYNEHVIAVIPQLPTWNQMSLPFLLAGSVGPPKKEI